MPGASPSEAIDRFLDPIRVALACLPGNAQVTLSRGARAGGDKVHRWFLNDGQSAAVLTREMLIDSTMHFRVLDLGRDKGRERYRATTVAYSYTLLGKPKADGSKREILAVHWHPESKVSDFVDPHYHVGAAAIASTGVFTPRTHLPTHRISFEEFVRLLIDQFGVPPACDDWSDRLAKAETTFEAYRSWG